MKSQGRLDKNVGELSVELEQQVWLRLARLGFERPFSMEVEHDHEC